MRIEHTLPTIIVSPGQRMSATVPEFILGLTGDVSFSFREEEVFGGDERRSDPMPATIRVTFEFEYNE